MFSSFEIFGMITFIVAALVLLVVVVSLCLKQGGHGTQHDA